MYTQFDKKLCLHRVHSGPFVEWQTVKESREKIKWFVDRDTATIDENIDIKDSFASLLLHIKDDKERHHAEKYIDVMRRSTHDESEHSNYKLTSFEGRGEAEVIRLVLAVADITYEECRITEEEWDEIKDYTPYGTLPLLYVGDQQFGEVSAIARTLSYKYFLMGKTNKEHLIVEATYERLRRLQLVHSKAYQCVTRGEKSKEKMEWAQSQMTHVILPQACREWEPLIMDTPGPFVIESGMSLADIAIMDFVDQCSSNLILSPILADFPAVSDLITMVQRDTRIQKYLDERLKE